MIKIYNDIIPFPGFMMMNINGLLFIRSEYKGKISDSSLNHEAIHSRQQWEMLFLTFIIVCIIQLYLGQIIWWLLTIVPILSFYILYLLFWLIQTILPPWDTAYYDICFEVETYSNEKNLSYLKKRKPFSWVKYIFTNFKVLKKKENNLI